MRRMLRLSSIALAALASALSTGLAAQDPAVAVTVRSVIGADLVVFDDGRRMRLQGISLPDPVVRPTDFAEGLRRWIREQVLGRELYADFDGALPFGDRADLVGVLRIHPEAESINAAALRAGRAIFSCRSSEVRAMRELADAARSAQRERRGWFASTPRAPLASMPYLNGAVVGLHHRDPARGYESALDEVAAAGFRHISLIFPAFVEDAKASRIDRFHERTVADSRLLATIRYAREVRGLSVMLLPIVLLEHAGDDDWRGTLRPRDEPRFWSDYDRFLSHYLDIAEATGVEIVSVGSELGALEDRTATWQRIIANARGRFTGLLTYSANWDHVHVPRFFDRLDAVGMTAYFSLSDSKEPSATELAAGWRRVGADIERTLRSADVPRPVFFTEVGYASQNGINTDPWNYFIATGDIDVDEQAACFRAAREVLPEFSWLHGAYWFEYFGEGGRGDHSYSPRGKPAMRIWEEWAALEVDRVISRQDGVGR